MSVINSILIHVGDAALWLWATLGTVFGRVGGAIDAVLNPVLSPVLAVLNPACTAFAGGVYAVLGRMPPVVGLILLAVIVGTLMLIGFRYTSNQAAIGRARDAITANLLALRLFKDDFRVALRSQRRALWALCRLQWHMIRPVLIMALPIMLVFAQMGAHYQWRPLRPGEETLLTLHLRPGLADAPQAVLQDSPAVAEATGPASGGGELVWRIRCGTPGRHVLRFDVLGTTIEKELVVANDLARVSPERPGRRWTSQLLYPVEKALPRDSAVRSVEIAYPELDSWVYGSDWWILWFFVVSMVAALLLKPVFKVRF